MYRKKDESIYIPLVFYYFEILQFYLTIAEIDRHVSDRYDVGRDAAEWTRIR